MYRIGEFSKMSKTTIKTLRYYDEISFKTPGNRQVHIRYTPPTSCLNFTNQSYRQIGFQSKKLKCFYPARILSRY